MSAATDARTPRFLAHLERRPPAIAPFARQANPPIPIVPPPIEPVLASLEVAPPPPVSTPPTAPVPPPPAPVAASPAPIPPPPAQESGPGRLSDALDRLRLVGFSLAEQARADAMEIGFLVAKRILETEIRASPEALFSLVRGALEKVGQARSVSVRLCPADAERVGAAGGAHAWSGLTVAEVNVVADPNLGPGDVVIDSDLGHVDGRLDTRLAELRAAAPPSGGAP